ncbi:hypothetical protein FRB98_009441 [Tulasnella sp. 332]|nr:hypothetical protein FRB98_009441 [Tulasnella sp. 332]
MVEQLLKCISESTQSFILYAKEVAMDKVTGKLLPFQKLSKWKCKDVKVEDIQVQAFIPIEGEFGFATSSDSESIEDIQTFLEQSMKEGCEGLMVEMMESTESYYEQSWRSVNWLKLKKDHPSGVGELLALVVVGAYRGKGKHTNVYSVYLLVCYDADSEQFQTICKIGTGFSDKALTANYVELKPLEIGEKLRGDINMGGAKPDVWLEL